MDLRRLANGRLGDPEDRRRRHADKNRATECFAGLTRDEPATIDAIEQQLRAYNEDPDALHELLERQHYRLAYWRAAARDSDYRRFFDITRLVGVAHRGDEVFERYARSRS